MASNAQSKFSPFTLQLEDNITITGLKYIPDTPSQTPNRPLLIFIHGATCTAHNFDVGPGNLTATTFAAQLSIPIISVNRPGYLDSTALSVPEDSTYHKTLGHFNHHTLFPALWHTFGQPNNCTALVPLAHSLGAPGIIISSALHSQDTSPEYPLAGMIFSGWGTRSSPHLTPAPISAPTEEKLAWKRLVMLGDPKYACAPPESYAAVPLQDHPMIVAERHELLTGIWNGYWREYSDNITVPIMWGQGEHDRFYEGSLDHVREYRECFARCARFDASLVLGAPHAIEWSYLAAGWYTRCFGFAVEVTEWLARKGELDNMERIDLAK